MASTDPKRYDYGARIRHKVKVEVDDSPEDPTTITLYLMDPLGNQTGPFTPTKWDKGLYIFEKTYTAATPSAAQGMWTAKWLGGGVAEGAKERKFQINTSKFSV